MDEKSFERRNLHEKIKEAGMQRVSFDRMMG